MGVVGLPTKVFFLFICLVSVNAAGKNWALLIAGSNTWDNYSAQSSVCHAYQTLIKSGFSNETIVVMMFDDIANNPKNPLPGKIINRPNGNDVYKGVPKHYTKDEITAKTFLAVLRGDKAAVQKLIGRNGKVIESGPEDNIFIFYIDHGSHRLVLMPDNNPHLYARQLNNTLTEMYQQKKYNQVLIYLEACESGSMFYEVLSPSIKVYATTAVGPTNPAYMIFYEPRFGTSLSGEYSCNWERDNDAANTRTETIGTQFEDTKKNTRHSVPHEYGDMSIKKKDLSYFFGPKHSQAQDGGKVPPCTRSNTDRIPLPMAKIAMISKQLSKIPLASEEGITLKKKLDTELQLMQETQDIFDEIAKVAFKKSKIPEKQVLSLVYNGVYPKDLDYDCYEDAVDILTGMCPNLHGSYNSYAMPKLISLARACNARGYKDVVSAVKTVLMEHPLCCSRSDSWCHRNTNRRVAISEKIMREISRAVPEVGRILKSLFSYVRG